MGRVMKLHIPWENLWLEMAGAGGLSSITVNLRPTVDGVGDGLGDKKLGQCCLKLGVNGG